MPALLTVRMRPLFWSFVVAFNIVGFVDIVVDYYHATQVLPTVARQLGAGYWIPVIYVPLLMITHIFAFYLLLRRSSSQHHGAQLCGEAQQGPRPCRSNQRIAYDLVVAPASPPPDGWLTRGDEDSAANPYPAAGVHRERPSHEALRPDPRDRPACTSSGRR